MEINLLPWRKEVLQYNKKQFFIFFLGALFFSFCFLWIAYSAFFSQTIDAQYYIAALNGAKSRLNKQLTELEKNKPQYQLAENKVKILENLQYNRFTTIKFFNAITKIIPKGIYLLKMSKKGETIEMIGIANSNFLIAELMKSINASRDMTTLSLKKVERVEKNYKSITDFDLQIATRTMLYYIPSNAKKTLETEKSSAKLNNIFDEKREEVQAIFLKKSLEK